ncbi:TadE/TadG family type IV pilus assembly protein [Amycolatopsis sp. La24]|uniref:TadE/TadG family type IV pilus assembly protein n=1 Tax=Amycolatopsis sp. La24 TaxID=3028304 RepID=UPI0023B073B9|nr:TadE/TadG family type IV pilus assembly protein [Amycolatopsis sp. La24]
MNTESARISESVLPRDAGAETVGLAILFPLVLLLILAAVQGGLWWHAHSVVSQAAQTGADAGRPVGATGRDAAEAARSFVDRAGHGMLTAPQVDGSMSPQVVQVDVSGTAIRLVPIPGLDLRVTATARVVKERFTVPSDGGGS